jgi:hypothetical protein
VEEADQWECRQEGEAMSCNMCRDGKTALGRPCPNRCPVPSPDHETLIRWLRGLAENTVTNNGSRRSFVSDMYFEAADAIATMRDAVIEECAEIADQYLRDGDWDRDACEAIGRHIRGMKGNTK